MPSDRLCSYRHSLIFALLLAAAVPLKAELPTRLWSCSNSEVEVVCLKEERECLAASGENVIPPSLTFDEQGNLSVCAYTGCWQGAGRVQQVDSLLVIQAEQLPFYPLADSYTDIYLLFNPKEQLAFLRADFFAQPFYCHQSN